jgi:hypothetical protein
MVLASLFPQDFIYILAAIFALAFSFFWVRRTSRRMSEAAESSFRSLQAAHQLALKLEAALNANEDFQRSRDEAWSLYRRSSIAAGNAQSWLFRELQNSYFLINKYRQVAGESPIQVPADLESAVIRFRQEHVEKEMPTE